MVVTTFLANVIAISLLIYRHTISVHMHYWPLALYAVFLFVLIFRARRLKRRAADLVMAAATRCGLTRVYGDEARSRPAA